MTARSAQMKRECGEEVNEENSMREGKSWIEEKETKERRIKEQGDEGKLRQNEGEKKWGREKRRKGTRKIMWEKWGNDEIKEEINTNSEEEHERGIEKTKRREK